VINFQIDFSGLKSIAGTGFSITEEGIGNQENSSGYYAKCDDA
jgi:hypothetical protein